MIEPTADPDPQDEAGDQVKLTLSMTAQEREWIEERAEERGMNLSEYMRAMATAGERQLIALERLADEDNHGEIETSIIERLPDDEADAVPAEELLEAVLDPVRETAYQILKQNSEIEYSPRQDGYYLE
jgi:DNA-directed RNA polymerase specialized sigma subunit